MMSLLLYITINFLFKYIWASHLQRLMPRNRYVFLKWFSIHYILQRSWVYELFFFRAMDFKQDVSQSKGEN